MDFKEKERLDISSMSIENSFECTAVETINNDIPNRKRKNIIVVIYRIPDDNNLSTFFSCFEKLLQHLEADKYKNCIYICGDFNIDMLVDDEKSCRFRMLLLSFGYKIIFNEPTRKTPTTATCIDNIITNNYLTFDESMCKTVDFGISDHLGQIICHKAEIVNSNVKRYSSKRIISQENIRSLYNCLSAENWNNCMSQLTCNESFNVFFNTVYSSFVNNCPITTKVVNNNKGKSAWVTRGIKVSSRRKWELYKISRYNSNPAFMEYFKNYKRVFRKVVSAAKKVV